MDRPKVILVEDDQATLAVFAEALREEFAVWVARDGAQALEVANELDWDADALVIDLALGGGPRGDEFVAAYRRRSQRPGIPVIVVSGAARAYELSRHLRPQALLFKPIEIAELLRKVRLFV